MPALLAIAAVHHELVRAGLRTRTSLVIDSGEPREVHHFACLVGYGADAVHGWLAGDGIVPGLGPGAAEDDVEDGRLDRLGLPRRAGFEAIGLAPEWWTATSPARRRRSAGSGCAGSRARC